MIIDDKCDVKNAFEPADWLKDSFDVTFDPDIKFSLSSKSLSICPSQMYNSKLKKSKIPKIMLTDGIRFSNSLIRVFMATSMLVTDVGDGCWRRNVLVTI